MSILGEKMKWADIKQCVYVDEPPVDPGGEDVEVETSSGVVRVDCDLTNPALTFMMLFFGVPMFALGVFLVINLMDPDFAPVSPWVVGGFGVGLVAAGGAALRHGVRALNRTWSIELRPDEAVIRDEPLLGRHSETRVVRRAFEHVEIMGPDRLKENKEARHRLVVWTQLGEISLLDGADPEELVFAGRVFHQWSNGQLFDDEGMPRIEPGDGRELTVPDEDLLERHRYVWRDALDERSAPEVPEFTDLEVEADVDELRIDIPRRDVGWHDQRQRLELRVDYLSVERSFFVRSSVRLYERHDIVDVAIRECDNREGHPMFAVDIELPDDEEAVAHYCSRADQLFVARVVRWWCDDKLFDDQGRLEIDVAAS